jgi:hypothetical protein
MNELKVTDTLGRAEETFTVQATFSVGGIISVTTTLVQVRVMTAPFASATVSVPALVPAVAYDLEAVALVPESASVPDQE